MAQVPTGGNYVVDNSTGANVRADINEIFDAILTVNSGSSSPSYAKAYTLWADTNAGTMKIRNGANNAWIELFQLDGTLTLEDGSASTPALAFRDDLDTGIYSSAANTFNVATGGVERMELGATTIFNEDGADVDFRIEGDTEANLFYVDAGNDRIGIGGTTTPDTILEITDGGTEPRLVRIHNSSTNGSAIQFTNTDTGNSTNQGLYVGLDAAGHGNFYHQSNFALIFATNNSEGMRLDESGRLLIGTTTEGSANADDLTIGTSADTGMTIRSGTSSAGSIFFSDATSGNAEFAGFVQYLHNNNSLSFGTDETTRMTINNSGAVGIGTTSPQTDLHITDTSAAPTIRLSSAANGLTELQFGDANDTVRGNIVYRNGTAGDALCFNGYNNTERMRIDSSGQVGIGTTSPSRKLEITDATFSALRIKNSSTSIANGTNICGIEFEHADSSAAGVCAGINALMADTSTGALHMTFSTGTNVNLYRENMRIASDGTVQIAAAGAIAGFSSSHINSGAPLKIYKSSSTSHAGLQLIWDHFNTTAGISQKIQFTIGDDASADGFNNAGYIGIEKADSWQSGSGRSSALIFGTTSAATESEKMRILSNGDLFVGCTALPSTSVTGFAVSDNAGKCLTRHATSATTANNVCAFFNPNGLVGVIQLNGSGTTYVTTSDYRLKENATEISDGITKLKTLKPYRFNFKADPTKTVDGFFAHEVTAVPEAITGIKDEIATQAHVNQGLAENVGDPVYQGIDQSKLVPLLTAALQEAIGKIEVLETKVAALEAA